MESNSHTFFVSRIHFTSFFNFYFSIAFWKCSDQVVFVVFILSYLLKNITNFLQDKELNQTYRRLITNITKINMVTMTTPATTPPIIPKIKKYIKNKEKCISQRLTRTCFSFLNLHGHHIHIYPTEHRKDTGLHCLCKYVV